MQVVPLYWRGLIGRLAGTTFATDDAAGRAMIDSPALALRAGAAILRDAYDRHGSWDKASSEFFTGTPNWAGIDSVNGTTGAGYKRSLDALVKEWGAAAGTTPAPATTTPAPTPADPLSAILGGAPVPAIDYGWLADAGLHYYGYVVGHGGQRDTQHPGIDIPLPYGSALHSPGAGLVRCVGYAGAPDWGQACGAYADTDTGGVGNLTILLDGGVKLTLGHVNSTTVRPGDRVAAGQLVARSGGMNGPPGHVHVETSVRNGGTYRLVEPVAALRSVMGGGTTPAPRPTLNVEVAIADDAGRNRPKTKLLPGDLWVTVHETANEDPGADARMHRDFVNGGGGPEAVSFHFAVDDVRAVQILPLDEIAYHAGDRCDDPATDHGCFRSVAIEVCVNAPRGSARWAKAKSNAAALIAGIVATPEKFVGGGALRGRFSFDRVAPHQKWSGKNCPARMLAEGSLPAVVAEARSIAAGGTTPLPAEPPILLKALFPQVDISGEGVVSAKWLECRSRDNQHYPFIRSEPDGAGVLWVFAGLVLRSESGDVEEVSA